MNLAVFHLYAKYVDKYITKITTGEKLYHYNLKSCSYYNKEAGA